MTAGDEPPFDKPAVWRERIVSFALFLLCGVIAGFIVSRTAREPAAHSIAFNHKLHVTTNQIDCATCHPHYEQETFSGFPDAETCSLCHSDLQGGSAEEKKLLALLKGGAQLEWGRLFQQPPHVFYSHRRHVVNAGIKCETCHGAIASAERPPARVSPLTMEQCIDCHRRSGVAVDCTTCHR